MGFDQLPIWWLAFLVIAIGWPLKSFQSETSLEAISDIDIKFLARLPKMPWAKDPFLRRPGYAVWDDAETKLTLEAIVRRSESEATAIINGEELSSGEVIKGRTVEQIGPNFVLLRKGESLRELVLPPVEEGEYGRIHLEEVE